MYVIHKYAQRKYLKGGAAQGVRCEVLITGEDNRRESDEVRRKEKNWLVGHF